MARYVCASFAELSDSFGDLAGQPVGDRIRDYVVDQLGQDGEALLDSGWVLEWEGWNDVRETVRLHDAAEDGSDPEAVYEEVKAHMHRLLQIASDNQDVPLKSDEDRLEELELMGLRRGRGLVHGRNDCLADSLLQSMARQKL